MKQRNGGRRGEIEKLIEFARKREERPQLKPINYTFEPARRPDLIIPERPRADISAADRALHEIKDYASKARELYRERRRSERPVEAREYVRHQLALGMLDAPVRRAGRPDVDLGKAPGRAAEPARHAGQPRPRGFGFWRRRERPEG